MLLKCHKTATAGPGGSIPDTDQLQAQKGHCSPKGNSTIPVLSATLPGSSETGTQKQEKKLKNKSPGSRVLEDAAEANFRASQLLCSLFTAAQEGLHLPAPVLTWGSLCGRMAERKSVQIRV